MSYNVALFDFPIPNDFEKACEYFENMTMKILRN